MQHSGRYKFVATKTINVNIVPKKHYESQLHMIQPLEVKHKFMKEKRIFVNLEYNISHHISKLIFLCSSLNSKEMLQNFLYLYKKKTQVPKRFTSTSTSFFRFSLQATFIFPIMNALVYVDIDQGIFKVKMKVAQNVKVKNY